LRVLIASSFTPYVPGGGTAIVDDLATALKRRGHEVDTILLPVSPDARQLPEHLLALRLLDVTQAGDVLVAIRPPAHALRHPRKVLWFIHHQRDLYDLWGTPYQNVDEDRSGLVLREAVRRADNEYLREAEQVFTNSEVVSERLWRFNRLRADVLHPPLPEDATFRADSYGDYVFCPSRLSAIKRQTLLIEAMAHVETPVRLVLAGPPDEPQQLARLQAQIAEHGLEQRVELHGSWISEERKRDLFADALACAYVPFDEDSYGYVTLESFHARKPVITCSDSGGTLELVEDGVTGLVVEPSPQALAAAFDGLQRDKERARALGEGAFARLEELEISWDTVVERLLA
jgi:glycosyltransferase involved in cell wall biosynthesis